LRTIKLFLSFFVASSLLVSTNRILVGELMVAQPVYGFFAENSPSRTLRYVGC
jgi:hypothetical protein